MKIALAYASKYGAVKEIAQLIQKDIDLVLIDLKKEKICVSDYDVIIIGTSVYAGMMQKEVKQLIHEQSTLLDKKVFMFLSGLNKDDTKKVIVENVGETFYQNIICANCLGGKLDFSKMNFMEKTMIKAINKKAKIIAHIPKDECVDLLDHVRIASFIRSIQAIL
ncbi:MAG: flavodoxin domain-containing protein [Longicatena sp.]